MTERFKLIEESDWWGVTDNQLPKTEYGFREDLPNGYLSCDYKYNDLTPQEVVDLLNALHEENERLKEEKQQWYRIDSRLRVRIKQLEEEISDTN